jgi:pimeloyl-ACP methyl ester carboxylesterase
MIAPDCPQATLIELPDTTLRVWQWGAAHSPPVVLVHGWADSGATFEFVAQHLAADYRVIAPDLRGFGESALARRSYWFADYLRDLDAVLDATVGHQPVTLVGHSMGGNVCGLYAGVRPARVASLVLLEGFGMPPTTPAGAPARYARWLDQQATPPVLRDFVDLASLLKHLRRLAPAASDAVLLAVVPRWAQALPDGGLRLRMDPQHKAVNAVLYRRDEAAACWRATLAPVTLVAGAASDFATRFAGMDPMADCASHYREVTQHTLADCGHMMHWEQPAAVAALIRAAASRVNP